MSTDHLEKLETLGTIIQRQIDLLELKMSPHPKSSIVAGIYQQQLDEWKLAKIGLDQLEVEEEPQELSPTDILMAANTALDTIGYLKEHGELNNAQSKVLGALGGKILTLTEHGISKLTKQMQAEMLRDQKGGAR